MISPTRRSVPASRSRRGCVAALVLAALVTACSDGGPTDSDDSSDRAVGSLALRITASGGRLLQAKIGFNDIAALSGAFRADLVLGARVVDLIGLPPDGEVLANGVEVLAGGVFNSVRFSVGAICVEVRTASGQELVLTTAAAFLECGAPDGTISFPFLGFDVPITGPNVTITEQGAEIVVDVDMGASVVAAGPEGPWTFDPSFRAMDAQDLGSLTVFLDVAAGVSEGDVGVGLIESSNVVRSVQPVDSDGSVSYGFLFPGLYGVVAVPPAGVRLETTGQAVVEILPGVPALVQIDVESATGREPDFLAGGSFLIPAASGPGDDGFAKAILVAEVLEEVPSATGRRLVFTLRDSGRPGVTCEEGSSEECAVVVWSDGTGDLGNRIRIMGGQGIDLTLTSDGTLQEQPEGLGPGSLSTSVGGSEQSWSVVLDRDLPVTGEVALELVMTKLGDPNVLMEWTLHLEDPTAATPSSLR